MLISNKYKSQSSAYLLSCSGEVRERPAMGDQAGPPVERPPRDPPPGPGPWAAQDLEPGSPGAAGLKAHGGRQPWGQGIGSMKPRTHWLGTHSFLTPRWHRDSVESHAFMCMSAKRPMWTRWQWILGNKRQQLSLCVAATGRWPRTC